MKLLIMPSSIEQVNNTLTLIDGIIVGLDKLCINMPNNFNYSEIKELIKLCKDNNKEIFVSLNKNIHNSELEYLKKIMIDLDNYDINGLLYYDIALVNIKKVLNLKTPLVWNQEHLTTNYLTSNYWYDHGAIYTYLSSEITLDEVNEIANNCKALTMITMFGYLPMFVSRRHLVKNYLDTFNINDKSKINYIEKESKRYQIIDNDEGTIAYSSSILNGIDDILNIKTDYIVLNSFSIDSDLFVNVVDMFKNANSYNIKEYKERIDSILNTDTGFLHQETIYKVK